MPGGSGGARTREHGRQLVAAAARACFLPSGLSPSVPEFHRISLPLALHACGRVADCHRRLEFHRPRSTPFVCEPVCHVGYSAAKPRPLAPSDRRALSPLSPPWAGSQSGRRPESGRRPRQDGVPVRTASPSGRRPRRLGVAGASWQRCRTHYAANLMSVTPKASWPWVKTMLHSVYDQPDAVSVHAQYDRLVDAARDKLPKVADHLEAARADVLAFTPFPEELCRQIWSNNPQERLNREIRSRTDVAGIFPGRDALIRLVGAVLAEQHDEWTEGRRYLGLDILARSRVTVAPASTDPTPEVTPASDLRRSAPNPQQRITRQPRNTTSRDLTPASIRPRTLTCRCARSCAYAMMPCWPPTIGLRRAQYG